MARYLARRLLITAPVLLGVTAMAYLILSLTPGDPVQALIDPNLTPQDVAIKRHALGLDRPCTYGTSSG